MQQPFVEYSKLKGILKRTHFNFKAEFFHLVYQQSTLESNFLNENTEGEENPIASLIGQLSKPISNSHSQIPSFSIYLKKFENPKNSSFYKFIEEGTFIQTEQQSLLKSCEWPKKKKRFFFGHKSGNLANCEIRSEFLEKLKKKGLTS